MWKTKQLLARGRPPECALAVGDEAVHRNAHRVDQHDFKLVAPERRTIIAMRFAIELDIGLSFLLQAALPLVTSRGITRCLSVRCDGQNFLQVMGFLVERGADADG